jgi:Iap family predicted aminopeptidase
MISRQLRILWRLIVALFVVASSLSASASDGPVYSAQAEVFADTQEAPCHGKDRLAAVLALFKRYGATDADITLAGSNRIKNVVVTIRGSGQGYLVVGAHYDKANTGCGAIDNWTGVVLLTHVYKTLRKLRPKRTILFVAFDGEEEGLKGSKMMVKQIAKTDRALYCAMVDLDSFGFAIPQVLENVTTAKLLKYVRDVAAKFNVPLASESLAGVADADSSSFISARIPAVTLHGLSNDGLRIIHTQRDTPELIQPASMYAGYILSLDLVAHLDECDCGAFR